ncbi:RNA 2',3'-cyclic phosphodiesterase [Salicibibacter halophilus]|uniref:RNA 2',3'-cyclic phosphodiesterase n=1 Tax=Salicibibacter halophilus TaxID=2502791 RepID=A0A514LH99_9BACI|nr:RNA 2',3'-cyclic phosphodiesterase [Salicibibacter halophilus]QDI91223.1 RNA 2',3'-cyclic phosphodiesterase [Salicibibacter halophilus]
MEAERLHYFLALSVPEDVQKKINELTNLRELAFFTSVTHIRDYHITLFFLGGVVDKELELLYKKLPVLVQQIPAFDVQLNQAGVFGKEERPRVLFAGVKRTRPLLDLQAAVAKGCVEAGFHEEKRPFRPHITIAKRRNQGGTFPMQKVVNETKHWKDIQWRVKEVGLYAVRLGQLPRYELKASFPLMQH